MAQAAAAAPQTRVVAVPNGMSPQTGALAQFAAGLAAAQGLGVTLMPTSLYIEAARDAQLGPHEAFDSAYAVRLGGKIGASHVLYLDSLAQSAPARGRRKARERPMLAAVLVDSATGETLFNRRYVAGADGLAAPTLRDKLMAEVLAALTQAAQLAPPGAPSSLATEPAVAAAATHAPAAPAAPSAATPAAPVAAGPAIAVPVKRPGAGSIHAEPAADEAAEVSSISAPRAPAAAPPARMAWGVRAQLGLLLGSRQATLSTLGVPQLQYGVAQHGAAPVFSRGVMSLEVMPARMVRHRRARGVVDGLGLHVAGSVGALSTRTSATTISLGRAGNVRGGLTFAYLFGAGPRAPELALRLGYGRTAFSVPTASAFPSLSYSSVYIDLSTELPLGTRKVALVVEAAILPALRLGNQAALLGVQRGQGMGAWVEAGLRFSPVAHLDILAQFALETYGAKFVGSTMLPNSAAQYASISLRDTSLGARLAVGTSF